MSFAKRPALAAAPAKPVAVPLKPVVEPVKSLLDDPDAVSPMGVIFRITGALIAAFAVFTAIALWMKPADWWEDDSSLTQPSYATLDEWDLPVEYVRLLFAAIV